MSVPIFSSGQIIIWVLRVMQNNMARKAKFVFGITAMSKLPTL
jgi:hypothetical protein